MDIRDLLDQQLDQKQIEEQMISQGRLVLQVVSHPGWQVILSHLLAAKSNEEKRREGGLSADPRGERALYYSGRVDGIRVAIETVNRIITDANEVEKTRSLNQGGDL